MSVNERRRKHRPTLSDILITACSVPNNHLDVPTTHFPPGGIFLLPGGFRCRETPTHPTSRSEHAQPLISVLLKHFRNVKITDCLSSSFHLHASVQREKPRCTYPYIPSLTSQGTRRRAGLRLGEALSSRDGRKSELLTSRRKKTWNDTIPQSSSLVLNLHDNLSSNLNFNNSIIVTFKPFFHQLNCLCLLIMRKDQLYSIKSHNYKI